MNERRTRPRNRSLIQGRILFNHNMSTFDVLIRDISQVGAKLVVDEAITVPDVFDLFLPHKDARFRSRVRWRRADQMGVEFLPAESPQPQKAPDSPGRVAALEEETARLRRVVEELQAELSKVRAEQGQ